jgi:predicted dehydrogenase
MKKIAFETAVIVGHGSIGKVHGRHLSKISKNLVIIDPVLQKLKYNNIASQIYSVSDLNYSNSIDDLVVISNWGPDHLSAMQIAVKKGYRQFVIEKPIVTSIYDLDYLVNLVRSKSLKVVVNQGWHYENLAEKINNLGGEYSLGHIQSIVTYGGARCISTGGSHIIHLANMIFKSEPTLLSACLNFDYINPRSAELLYVDGNAFIKFKNGSLCLNYSNQSSISGETKFLWKEAIGTLDGNKLTIVRRSKSRKYKGIITRYGTPEVKIYSSNLITEELSTTNTTPLIYRALKEQSFSKLMKDFNQHIISNKILIYCLISSSTKQTISYRKKLTKKLISTSFKIS